MLTVLITVIPWSSSSLTSCQRFSFFEPGAFVCASSSTSATCGLRAMTASVSISSRTTPLYSIFLRGMTSRSPMACIGQRPVVRFDEADDDVGAPLLAPPPSISMA